MSNRLWWLLTDIVYFGVVAWVGLVVGGVIARWIE